MSHERHASDRGVITAMFAVITIFLVLIIGVLAESGRKLGNLGRAEDIAAEAARAAAATLDLEQIAQGVVAIDGPARARTQADLIVDAVDDAEIEDFVIENGRVFVRVRVTGTSFLPAFDLDGVGSHYAVAYDPFGDR